MLANITLAINTGLLFVTNNLFSNEIFHKLVQGYLIMETLQGEVQNSVHRLTTKSKTYKNEGFYLLIKIFE